MVARVRSAGRYTRVEREDPPDAEGWVPLHMQFEEEHNACEVVLSFGPEVEVVEPTALRERVLRAAEGIVARYGAERQPPSSVEKTLVI